MHICMFSGSLPRKEAPSGIAAYVAVMRQAFTEEGHRNRHILQKESGRQFASTPGHISAFIADPPARPYGGVSTGVGGGSGAGAVLAHFANVHARDPFDVVEMEERFCWSDGIAPNTVLRSTAFQVRPGRDDRLDWSVKIDHQ